MELKLDRYNHVVLLVFLLVMFLLFPFFSDRPFSNEMFKLLFTAILIASVYTLSHERIHLIVAGSFGFLAIVVNWSGEIFSSSKLLLCLNFSFSIAFFFYIILVHVRQLISRQKVDHNLLYAALCSYILLGMLWGFIYALLDLFIPNAFHILASSSPPVFPSEGYNIPHFIYYSFITLTTLGYGDIVPALPVTQSFASLEAIVGQFYLTVLVARLVALYVSQRQ